MSRAGRLLLYGSVTALVLAAAHAAHAAPTAAVGPVTSGMKALGSHSENRVDHSIFVGDPGPEPAPRLFVTSAGDVSVTLDAPMTSLTASVAGAPVAVSQSGPLTYTVDVPEGQALPALVSVRIASVNGDWDGDATWGVELAAPPVALFSTPATATVAGSLLAALYGPHGGPTRIGDGFGFNAPTLLVAPGGSVTVKLTGRVNALTARLDGKALTAVKADDETYTVTLPTAFALPGTFSVELDYSTATFDGRSSFTADLVPLAPPALTRLPPSHSARITPPVARLSTTHGRVKAEVVSFCQHEASGGVCGDGAVIDPPDVIGTAGETVTIRVDTDVDSLVSGHGITPVRVDARTYTFPFPAGIQAPRAVTFFARHAAGDVTWAVELLAPDTPRVSGLRLKGRRLSVALACPARCDGRLTLRAANGRLAARFALDHVKRRTLTATVSRTVGRYLRRYSAMPVSARLSRPGERTIRTTLRLR